MCKKSTTCFSKKTGSPLTMYWSETEAGLAAESLNMRENTDFVHYQCRTCQYWHLAPSQTQDRSWLSSTCTDRNGEAKRSYPTEQYADRRARQINASRDVRVFSYRCADCSHWHLTKGH